MHIGVVMMSTGYCVEVLNRYIVHLQLIQHCVLTILELHFKKIIK